MISDESDMEEDLPEDGDTDYLEDAEDPDSGSQLDEVNTDESVQLYQNVQDNILDELRMPSDVFAEASDAWNRLELHLHP